MAAVHPRGPRWTQPSDACGMERVAWSVGNSDKKESVMVFLHSVVTAAQKQEPSFRFAAVLTVDDDAMQHAIE